MGLFEQMVQRNMQDTYNPQKVGLLQNRMNTLEGSSMSPGRKARLMGEAAMGLGSLGQAVDFSKFSGLNPASLSPGRADRLNQAQMGAQMNNMNYNAQREVEDAGMVSSLMNNRFARGGMLPRRLSLAGGTGSISDAQAAADRERICKSYGVCDPKPEPAAPAPQAPPPKPAPKPDTGGGLFGIARRALGGRDKALAEATNYAEGGLLPRTITEPVRSLRDSAVRAVDKVKQRVNELREAPPQQRANEAADHLGGMTGGAVAAIRNRQQQLAEADNYAEGGIVRGKGGPTDDAVPMEIGNVPVNLSDQEAVLPAKTVRTLGGAKAVERLIEMTNGKPPVEGGLRAGGRYSQGARPLSDEEKAVISATYAGGRPTDEGAYPVPNNTGRYGQSLAMQDALKMGAETSVALASRAGDFASGKIRKAGEPIPASPAPTPVEKPGLLESGVKTAVGTAALPFAALTDGAMNLAASAVGAERPEPDKYTAAADTMSREGISGLGLTTAGSVDGVKKGVADVMGWKPVATEAKRPEPAKEVPAPQAAPVTPEQAAVEAARQNALDVADMEARRSIYNNVITDTQRQMNFPAGADFISSGNHGIRALVENKPGPMNEYGSRTAGPMDRFNAANDAMGTGIRYDTVVGSDGKRQLRISDIGAAPKKPQYLGADGRPTDKWENTAAYTDGLRRAQLDKQRLAELRAENRMSDLKHYWGPKLGGMLQEAFTNQHASAQGKNALSAKDLFDMEKSKAEFQRNLDNDAFNRKKHYDDVGYKEKTDYLKGFDERLKMAAKNPDGTDNPARYNQLQSYFAHFNKKGGDPNQNFEELMDVVNAHKMFEDGAWTPPWEAKPDGRLRSWTKTDRTLRGYLAPWNWGKQAYRSNDGLDEISYVGGLFGPNASTRQLDQANKYVIADGKTKLTPIEREYIRRQSKE